MKINVALSPTQIFKCENLCRRGPATSKVDFETEKKCLAFLHKRAGPGSQDNPKLTWGVAPSSSLVALKKTKNDTVECGIQGRASYKAK